MSEYQYYEFRAIDRPLDKKQMARLRALSTRADITDTSFTNDYQWGDFKGDSDELMDRDFDAFVYVANWGTHEFKLRLPRKSVDVERFEAYCDGDALSLRTTNEHVVLTFYARDENGDFADDCDDGRGWMASLIPLRDDLLRGDLRALYLGWLFTLCERGLPRIDADAGEHPPSDFDGFGAEEYEPPVPDGLKKLSAPLRGLASFLRVDDDLLDAAAQASTGEAVPGPSTDEMKQWITSLPEAEKNAYLFRFLNQDGDIALRAEMAVRFREASHPGDKQHPAGTSGRTVAQLLEAWAERVRERIHKEARKKEREEARRKAEEEKAHAKKLQELARREPELWSEVEQLIASKQTRNYESAVALLVDLHDLASRNNRAWEADERIRNLRQRHAAKPAFLRRLDQHMLGV